MTSTQSLPFVASRTRVLFHPPFSRQKRKPKKSKRTKGGQKGHKPQQQQILAPNESHWLMPERCSCGQSTVNPKQMQPFYVHQHIELPEIEMEVRYLFSSNVIVPQRA
jgi:hypothetical protein